MTKRVLFLCTGNMARSILAEAILRQDGAGLFEAFSAGSDAAGMVAPFAIETLKEKGYSADGLSSKDWEVFAGPDAPRFDYVIAISSQARDAVFPAWTGGGELIYWPVTDPILVEGNQARMRANFENCFDDLKKNIDAFIAEEAGALRSAV